MTRFACSLSVVAAVAAVLLLAATSPAAAAPQGSKTFGTGNINSFLSNPNIVRETIDCLKDTAPCKRLGVSLKQAIPEVVNNRCARCNPSQAANAQKLIDYVRANHPQDYRIIIDKYTVRSG
ncbi:hypothetical protein ONE63_005311 [Megalurothrips usitatus]|uniref:Uncharacterized protein n=1 Tax=Megalurothrips usitatus TaxID=439358 RepID=A0AAV7XZ43_9NEOP|nr:hypothetical protein ONE63_005311 [Megalurothrips usitatus]